VFNVSMLESEGPLRGPTSNRLLSVRRTPLRVGAEDTLFFAPTYRIGD